MNFLDFILPPALGAFIGYLTNAIAIKMLFKPYKEWRIFGFRVPFTPGIIPKNRDELAHNIGKMVGDILLNEETLQKQLVSEHSHKVIDTIIHDNLDRLLNYDCPTLYKLIPTDIRDMFLSYYSTAKEKIKLLIDNFFMGNPLNELVKNIVSLQIEKISEKKLSDLLSQSDIKAFISIIFNNLFNNLVKKDFVKDWLNKSLDQLKTVNVELNRIVPYELINILIQWVKNELPQFIDYAEEAVYNSNMDKKLFITFRKMIIDYLSTLNKVQRFIVNMWGVEERVDEDLPVVIQQAISQVFTNLKSDESQDQIIDAVHKAIHSFMDKGISDLLNKIDDTDYNKLKNNIINKIETYFENNNNVESWLNNILNIYDTLKDTHIEDFFKQFNVSKESVSNSVSKLLLKTLQSDETKDNFFKFIEMKLDNLLYNHPLGKLRDLFSIKKIDKEKMSNFLSKKILALLQKDISYVVDAINVRKVVIEKINLFPLDKVENLMLSIIKKHLKWINIFGAILGLLIGTLQIIFNLLKN